MESAHAWTVVLSYHEAVAELRREYVELYAEDAFEAAEQILDRELTPYEKSAARATAVIDWTTRVLNFIIPSPVLDEHEWNEAPIITTTVSFILRP